MSHDITPLKLLKALQFTNELCSIYVYHYRTKCVKSHRILVYTMSDVHCSTSVCGIL